MLYFKHLETGEVFAYETQAERDVFGAPVMVAMTPAEIDAHLNPPPDYAAQIAELERQHMLPKATRKFMLSFMEATAIQQGAGQGLTAEQSLAALAAGNPGYAAVKELDNQIEALEALL